MKTTSKIAVAAFLIGSCGLGTRAMALPATPNMAIEIQALTYEQAMQVLSAAHEQYWYDQITMADLVQQYNNGTCTIEKVSEGYRVNGGGGLGTVLIGDFV